MRNLYIVVGRSGSGKSTIVEELHKKYGYVPIKTTTTRPRRFPGENTYHFVTQDEFDAKKEDIIAPTVINGCNYGITPEALTEGDLIITDVKGVYSLKKKYREKPVKVIGIHAPYLELEAHMKARGDSMDSIRFRLDNDEITFGMMDDYCDIIVNNKELGNAVGAVQAYIQFCENDILADIDTL